ncbi:response regulator transcription factor [Brevibacillus humidisoli]|uniref:response regulator n=1 Tax=Brevibacillus humidisoli TaxID=2895522 RepID=UPI001E3114F4|nr:response regulator transcription factor [Brevibacillus humidisoli]UFJ38937.1 response regulator transcription factor [Brevibacillus humidisoli]
MAQSYRVLIADDHPHAREAVRSLLAEDQAFVLVGEARNGTEALEQCRRLQPNLVLMDINMPGCDGLEATRQIKQHYPEIKVVVLSVSDNIADLFTAIQFGAQGYLLKNLDPDDWLTYLHALMEGTVEQSRELAGKLLYQFREGITDEEVTPSVLTLREREILLYVAKGETNRQIADRLVISEHTVKNHIKNILEKLHLENRVQLASFAVRHGLTRS